MFSFGILMLCSPNLIVLLHCTPFLTKENEWEQMAKDLDNEIMGFRERIAFGG